MDEKSFEAGGLIAIILLIGVLIGAKMFFPSLFTVLIWITGIIIALIIVFIGAVVYFALKKPKPGETEIEKVKANKAISDARTKVMSIRRLCMSIRNMDIRNEGVKVCSGADKILNALKQKPEKVKNTRQFFSYYLPTLGSIIEKYERVEKSGVDSGDMAEKVFEHLEDINSAFNKQYASLFDDDILDLSVEMEAMTIACKRDGLLTEEDFVIEPSEI